jgi:hypothetical protein
MSTHRPPENMMTTANTTTNFDNASRAIKNLEERAGARNVAANELLRMAERSTLSLVKEELLKGVCSMMTEEREFLKAAAKLRVPAVPGAAA